MIRESCVLRRQLNFFLLICLQQLEERLKFSHLRMAIYLLHRFIIKLNLPMLEFRKCMEIQFAPRPTRPPDQPLLVLLVCLFCFCFLNRVRKNRLRAA